MKPEYLVMVTVFFFGLTWWWLTDDGLRPVDNADWLKG